MTNDEKNWNFLVTMGFITNVDEWKDECKLLAIKIYEGDMIYFINNYKTSLPKYKSYQIIIWCDMIMIAIKYAHCEKFIKLLIHKFIRCNKALEYDERNNESDYYYFRYKHLLPYVLNSYNALNDIVNIGLKIFDRCPMMGSTEFGKQRLSKTVISLKINPLMLNDWSLLSYKKYPTRIKFNKYIELVDQL